MKTHIRIFYPADPVGVVPGGIDTFLRGMIKSAPSDLKFSLVGMTTDRVQRPLGRWTRCRIGSKEFAFFPVVEVADAGGRRKTPLSLRFTVGMCRYWRKVSTGFDIFDFHRPEPSLLFRFDRRPKNAYFHNDPATIHSCQSDNQWKRLPKLYSIIEDATFGHFDSAWCVRESGVETLRRRYPDRADQVRFIPTWVDAEVFNPADPGTREALRTRLANAHGLDGQATWMVTVGRLDLQKDPLLMLAAFKQLVVKGYRLNWLVIGDGVLRPEMQAGILAAGLQDHVRFLGLRPPAEIADILRAADVFALSSAYEGMPMALLEALGCGLPAAVTDVGEVRRVVMPGQNGAIAVGRDATSFADALATVVDNAPSWGGAPAIRAVAQYQPEKVLGVAYENYRRLAAETSLSL